MTENKRFTTNNGVFYTDNLTGWEFQSYGEVVDLMNELHERNQHLLSEIEDFQDLLTKNDIVCHKRILQLIDDKIAFFYKAQADMINDDDYRGNQISFAIQCLRELRRELSE